MRQWIAMDPGLRIRLLFDRRRTWRMRLAEETMGSRAAIRRRVASLAAAIVASKHTNAGQVFQLFFCRHARLSVFSAYQI